MDELKLLVQNTQKAWLLLIFCLFVFVVLFLTGAGCFGFMYVGCCTIALTELPTHNFLVNVEVQREKEKCLMHT